MLKIKSSSARIIGTVLLAGSLIFLPSKKVYSLENLVEGQRTVSGQVIDNFNEEPVVSCINLDFHVYIGKDNNGHIDNVRYTILSNR